MPHQGWQKVAPGHGKLLDRDRFKGLAPPGENARQTWVVIFFEVDQAAGDVNRTIGSKNQASAHFLGTPEIGGEAGGCPDRCRLRGDNAGWRHEKIARRRFVDPAWEEPSEGYFNRLISGIGEVDLRAPEITVATVKIVSEDGKNELTGSRR